ncbi:hypothetical protein AQI95_35995 [Streptomyces yokosukanensis]|uniref:Uncharacterized protein n=1 Tax=Streptomyces yokosukanensis TaxID=67386 RepID=A0A101NVB4_9ACTN|nr:hypothetical protein [Streptomyces yokosukanensis]KUM99919.1 hypothetical protein AQI95_35995 [Streptomyces yokosukanensis]
MAVTDHHDVFVGSTDDGFTFVLLNRSIRGAHRILTGAGFTVHRHQGRTLYLLPPETAQDAHECAGIAVYGLMAHTMDLVDLAWSTLHPSTTTSEPEATIRFHNSTVTAAAVTDRAGAVLVQHGFTPTGTTREYALPAGLGEADAVNAVVRAETHLYTLGVRVRVNLGIPTLRDIPPAPSRSSSAPAPPSPEQTQRRRR